MALLTTLFLIALSLSVDAFSLSLSLATLNISKKKMVLFTTLVGIMHFFMPLFGSIIGNNITYYLNINSRLLLGLILIILAKAETVTLINIIIHKYKGITVFLFMIKTSNIKIANVNNILRIVWIGGSIKL